MCRAFTKKGLPGETRKGVRGPERGGGRGGRRAQYGDGPVAASSHWTSECQLHLSDCMLGDGGAGLVLLAPSNSWVQLPGPLCSLCARGVLYLKGGTLWKNDGL